VVAFFITGFIFVMVVTRIFGKHDIRHGLVAAGPLGSECSRAPDAWLDFLHGSKDQLVPVDLDRRNGHSELRNEAGLDHSSVEYGEIEISTNDHGRRLVISIVIVIIGTGIGIELHCD